MQTFCDKGDKVSKIIIDAKNNKRAETSVEVFKLDKIYQAHLSEASELKRRIKNYEEFGEKIYEATFGFGVPFNIYSEWFGFMNKNMLEEPLIKLKQDIFKEYSEFIYK